MDKSKNIENFYITTEGSLCNNRAVTEMNDFFKNSSSTTTKAIEVPKKVKEKNNEILILVQNCNSVDLSINTNKNEKMNNENPVNETYNETYMKHVKKLSQTIQDMNINDALMDERVVEGCFKIIKRNIKRSTINYHSNLQLS